jgi:hypothetical protein
MRTLQTFVVRILHRDEFGSAVHGQISEPTSGDEWRATFSDMQELLSHLQARLALARGDVEIDFAVGPLESNKEGARHQPVHRAGNFH